jgi:hypothetical protein
MVRTGTNTGGGLPGLTKNAGTYTAGGVLGLTNYYAASDDGETKGRRGVADDTERSHSPCFPEGESLSRRQQSRQRKDVVTILAKARRMIGASKLALKAAYEKRKRNSV